MLSRSLKPGAVYNGSRKFSTCSVMEYKVVVTGAAGGIGQPLSLLLKQDPLVTRLALYDIAPILPGVAIDLSHMNTPAIITGYKSPETLPEAISVKAKAGGGSATLSMAYAGLRITNAILRGLNGDPNIIECAYVQSDLTEATYFASPVMFGRYGIEKNLGFGILHDYEETLVEAAIPILMANIKTGESYVLKI